MQKLLLALALAGVGAFLGDAGAATQSGCSKAAAKAAVLASSLPQRWKDEARHKYGPIEGLQGVLCHDFTRDGRTDMAVTFYSGGTAGDVAWVAFRRAGARWKLALARLDLYKMGLVIRDDDLVETQPVYKPGDGNCCPTGGFNHIRWHWDGSRFVVGRRWHDRSYRV
jgi:hypothetical protein